MYMNCAHKRLDFSVTIGGAPSLPRTMTVAFSKQLSIAVLAGSVRTGPA